MKWGFYRWFIPKFHAYLVVGQRARQYYLHYGGDEKKMYPVPHAVDNDFFASARSSLERGNLRKDWAIPKDAVVFVFAGKLVSRKRPLDFVKAIELTLKRAPSAHGLIVGDGPLRPALESYVRHRNLPVAFSGFLNQTEMPKAYAVSDALVLPSGLGETWGLVVNEAMASWLPAIVSDRVGCAPDLIERGETGDVFPCGDVQRLSEIMKSFVLGQERLREMGKKALQRIKEYSVAKAVEGTVEAIRAVVSAKFSQRGE